MPSAYEGTDIISYFAFGKIYHAACCISYCDSDISLQFLFCIVSHGTVKTVPYVV